MDYDLWLGPAPGGRSTPTASIYNFRWFWDYSGGLMTDWGVHHIDIIHWYLGADAPSVRRAVGGELRPPRQPRDARHAGPLFEYNGFSVLGSIHHGNARLIKGRD